MNSVAAENHGKFFSSEIEITSPSWMQGTLDHRGALFGPFPAGTTVKHELFYTSRKLCGDETPSPPDSVKQQGYFLLVDRGGCSFVEKVRNAQRDNATAVIIADNHCVCNSRDEMDGNGGLCPNDPTQACEDVVPVLDDDGTGGDITIPSFMIYKPDAEVLIEQLKRGTDVEVSLSWPVPQAFNERTEFVLWTTPDDVMNHQFIHTFASAVKELRNRAMFKPKMFIKDGTEKGCRRYDAVDPCPGYCTNWGRYCPSRLYDFDQYENKGVKMVVESLRRSCIWEIYGERDGIGMEWWSYMKAWILQCSAGSHYSAKCAEDIYLKAGVEKSLVEQCMEQSGNFRNNVENVLLDTAIIEAADFDVTFAPALYVNDAVIRGSLTYENALDAICATFQTSSSAPFLCSTWEDCKKTCPVGQDCYVESGECRVYQEPILETLTIYDNDDYIFEQFGNPTAQNPTNAIPTRSPTAKPVAQPTQTPYNMWQPMRTNPPVAPKETVPPQQPVANPTNAPTERLTQRPTIQPTIKVTVQPTLSPTNPEVKPVAAPTPEDGSKETINETVQIYEGGRGGVEAEPDIALILGLSIGLGCAFLISLAIFLLLRDRSRQDDMRQLSMEDSRSLVAHNFMVDEESMMGSRGRRFRMPRRHPDHEQRRSFRKFFRPRRARYEPRPPPTSSKPRKAFEEVWDDRPSSSLELDVVERVRGDYDADISDRDRPTVSRGQKPPPRWSRDMMADDDSFEEEY